MAFELRQSLKLTQQLIMTPQLQQAIKLLQLSRLELVDMVNQEMEENPLLEEGTADDSFESETAPEIDEIKAIDRTEEITGEGDGKEEFDWDSYLEDYGSTGGTYNREDAGAPSWDNMLTKTTSLTDHLMWQLNLSYLSDSEKQVGRQIIGNLDVNGYLTASLDGISEREAVDISFTEKVLKKIQGLDPPGIAARDLKECLLIQADLLGVSNPLIEVIIKEHLHNLETRNYANIAKKLKVQLSDVLQTVTVISNMNPKPGLPYNEERSQYIIPDVFVFKMGDDYRITLNDDGLPRLRISNFYREILGGINENSGAKSCKTYIKEKLQSATWLIKSIQQRQRTIYRVTESIVKFQKEFFEKGIDCLKPLILRDVADDIEMHESTISRVTTNKYMHSPRGIFELKYFFNSSINRISGDPVASESVKENIKKVIREEDQTKPYSDSRIVEIMEIQGISIARRTVAKYREMMDILPSSKRRKYF
ncbi:MAG: RNA polymerase factor sigma-54 [Syntrophales bacterium]|nr:RNA polymerase factor sigma-54 [Syntrophales bacterium]